MIKAVVNFSGGKDSTAAILKTLEVFKKDEIILCYENTGADYLETPEHIKTVATKLELPLVELAAKLDFWEMSRKNGFFPNASCRDCTGSLKQAVFYKWVRNNRDLFSDKLIIVSGIRADESLSRSRYHEFEKHEILTTRT